MSTKGKVVAWIIGIIVMVVCVMFWDVQFDDSIKTKSPQAAPASESSSVDYSL